MKKPDADARRLHPRLRVYANCDDEVNAVRADLSTAVTSTMAPKTATQVHSLADDDPSDAQRQQLFLAPNAVPETALKLRKSPKLRTRPPAKHAYVNVFVQFTPEQSGERGRRLIEAQGKVVKRMQRSLSAKVAKEIGGAVLPRRNFVSATIPVTMLDELKGNESVAFVHPAEPLKLDVPASSRATAPPSRAINTANNIRKVKGVLVGIIDVGGFDFAHQDFLDKEGKTRFHSIWDQGGTLRPPPKPLHLRFADHQATHGCGHFRREEAGWVAPATARVAVATGAGFPRYACRQYRGGQQGRVPGLDDRRRAHRYSATRR